MTTDRPLHSGAIVTFTANPALDSSTTVDSVAPEIKLRCTVPRHDPGGGGINVARAIHSLGGQALAVFPAGGSTGRTLVTLLEQEGVAFRAIPISQSTREDLSVEDSGKHLQYRFVMPGPTLSERELDLCLEALKTSASGASFLVASGSLPLGAPDEFYCRVIRVAEALGVKMVLDTSGHALLAAVKCGGVYLLKLSVRELEALAGANLTREQDRIDAAKAIVATGRVRNVVVSLGADGALLVTNDCVSKFAAIPVPVQSTIGAGDSTVAGLVLALSRGMGFENGMRFAMATAAASLLRPGTQLCRREDVARLYAAKPGHGATADGAIDSAQGAMIGETVILAD